MFYPLFSQKLSASVSYKVVSYMRYSTVLVMNANSYFGTLKYPFIMYTILFVYVAHYLLELVLIMLSGEEAALGNAKEQIFVLNFDRKSQCKNCTHICRIKGCGGAGWPPHQ